MRDERRVSQCSLIPHPSSLIPHPFFSRHSPRIEESGFLLMRYLALACDYDGTLATHGQVGDETVAALERLKLSGRKLLLVTGRELDDLFTVFPHSPLFEWIVAENGALLYQPSSREAKVLGDRPSERFIQRLRDRGVQPLSVGRVI